MYNLYMTERRRIQMPITKRLEDYLKNHNVEYRTVTHPETYTAQETAAAMHVQGRELAKSVMIKADGAYVMAVVPALRRVDLGKLGETLHVKDVRLANEAEFKGLFPDCEAGAEPPFGNLYNLETIVDESLAEDERIYFNAGNHYEAVEITYKEYEDLLKPRIADIAEGR
jgi:Ala-tRNA(Pro) deacylase